MRYIKDRRTIVSWTIVLVWFFSTAFWHHFDNILMAFVSNRQSEYRNNVRYSCQDPHSRHDNWHLKAGFHWRRSRTRSRSRELIDNLVKTVESLYFTVLTLSLNSTTLWFMVDERAATKLHFLNDGIPEFWWETQSYSLPKIFLNIKTPFAANLCWRFF